MRLVNVELSKAVIETLCLQRGVAYMVTKGLPSTAKLNALHYDKTTGHYMGTFYDASFEPILNGGRIPRREIELAALEVVQKSDLAPDNDQDATPPIGKDTVQ